jgi:hypothetical protein
VDMVEDMAAAVDTGGNSSFFHHFSLYLHSLLGISSFGRASRKAGR